MIKSMSDATMDIWVMNEYIWLLDLIPRVT